MFIFSRSAHSGLAIFSIGSRASSYRMRIPALRLLLLYILKKQHRRCGGSAKAEET